MFIILAIAASVTIILIRLSIGTPEIVEEKRSLEVAVDELEFQNFRKELVNAGSMSVNRTSNITANTNSFFVFGKDVFSSKAATLEGVTIGSVYSNAAAGSDVRLNVTVANYLNLQISTLILNFTGNGLTYAASNLEPGFTRETNFTFNTNTNANYTLWVYYATQAGSVTHNITIPADLGKSKFVGYYDIKLATQSGTSSDRFASSFDIP
jgi:hypothetical protein